MKTDRTRAADFTSRVAANSSDYAWANNNNNLANLKAKKCEAESLLGDFGWEYLVQDANQQRKKYTDARLEADRKKKEAAAAAKTTKAAQTPEGAK